jgi:hypothetical protein
MPIASSSTKPDACRSSRVPRPRWGLRIDRAAGLVSSPETRRAGFGSRPVGEWRATMRTATKRTHDPTKRTDRGARRTQPRSERTQGETNRSHPVTERTHFARRRIGPNPHNYFRKNRLRQVPLAHEWRTGGAPTPNGRRTDRCGNALGDDRGWHHRLERPRPASPEAQRAERTHFESRNTMGIHELRFSAGAHRWRTDRELTAHRSASTPPRWPGKPGSVRGDRLLEPRWASAAPRSIA